MLFGSIFLKNFNIYFKIWVIWGILFTAETIQIFTQEFVDQPL